MSYHHDPIEFEYKNFMHSYLQAKATYYNSLESREEKERLERMVTDFIIIATCAGNEDIDYYLNYFEDRIK